MHLTNTRVRTGCILVSPPLLHKVRSPKSPPDLLLVLLEVTRLWSLIHIVWLVNQTRLIMWGVLVSTTSNRIHLTRICSILRGLFTHLTPGKEHLGNLFIDFSFEPELPLLVRLSEVAATSHITGFHQFVRARPQLFLVRIFLDRSEPGYKVWLMIH